MPGAPLAGSLALTRKLFIDLILMMRASEGVLVRLLRKTQTMMISIGQMKMLTFEYVKVLLDADKDVPYRTCTICMTPMVLTTRQYRPHLISCKCRGSGQVALCGMSWEDLRTLLDGKNANHLN